MENPQHKTFDDREYKSIIEGLLFLWGDPLPARDIAKLLLLNTTKVHNLLLEMQQEMEHQRRGVQLRKYEDSYQLTTRKEHAEIFSQLVMQKPPSKLTNSSMETLAIIAYKQPVTRVEVDETRGVKSSSSIDTLLARGLIEEAGRLERIGRPILYRTTEKFLQLFEIESLDQLPEVDIELLEGRSDDGNVVEDTVESDVDDDEIE